VDAPRSYPLEFTPAQLLLTGTRRTWPSLRADPATSSDALESSVSNDFSMELRRRRTDAGLSLGELATLTTFSKGHLSRIERGDKQPSQRLARVCDTVLEADGALTALAGPPAGAAKPATDVLLEPLGEVWIMRMTADGSGDFSSMAQKTSYLSVPRIHTSFAAGSTPPDGHVLPTYRRWFDDMRRLGQVESPGSLTPLLVTIVHRLRASASDAGPSSRAEALRLAARFAEFTGWMAQENGDEAAATWWTNHAVTLAVEGGDHELPPYAFVRRAELALYRQDGLGTVALARQALTNSRNRRTLTLAAQREAQGHAVMGDRAACLRMLDHATELLQRPDEESTEPLLGSTTMHDPFAFVRGWCLHELGRSREAVEVLSAEFDLTPATASRSRARCGARLALAQAESGDIEGACETASAVIAHTLSINSATVRHDLRRLQRDMARWRSRRVVGRLTGALAGALRV
jgi:DNA-binding transcriptional regulator YiaG